MKKIVMSLVAVAALAFAGHAQAGEIYLTAFQNDKQAKVVDPKTKKTVAGAQVRVYTQSEFDKMTQSRKKNNGMVAELCGVKYYMSKQSDTWKKAHEDAKHEVRVRDHVSKGKYETICPKDTKRS